MQGCFFHWLSGIHYVFSEKKNLFKVVDSLSVLSYTHVYGHPSLVMQQGTSLSICSYFLKLVLCGIFSPCRFILSSLQAYIRFYCYKLHINCRRLLFLIFRSSLRQIHEGCPISSEKPLCIS